MDMKQQASGFGVKDPSPSMNGAMDMIQQQQPVFGANGQMSSVKGGVMDMKQPKGMQPMQKGFGSQPGNPNAVAKSPVQRSSDGKQPSAFGAGSGFPKQNPVSSQGDSSSFVSASMKGSRGVSQPGGVGGGPGMNAMPSMQKGSSPQGFGTPKTFGSSPRGPGFDGAGSGFTRKQNNQSMAQKSTSSFRDGSFSPSPFLKGPDPKTSGPNSMTDFSDGSMRDFRSG